MARKPRLDGAAALAAALLTIMALWSTAARPAGNETQPKTEADCRAYAARQAEEEYLANRNSLTRNAPFSPRAGQRDPYTASQLQQIELDRTAREQELYRGCLARLPKE